jgi:preprotein translocase subunit SecF
LQAAYWRCCAACSSPSGFRAVPGQDDLNTVAALLTILGYSINDTVVVGRLRENRSNTR